MVTSPIKQERDSNFELLRIISMLMVLNVHSFWGVENLSYSTLSFKVLFDFFREAISISCVNLFILISGYFSIRWKFKSICGLLFQVYFFVFLIYAVLLMLNIIEFNFKDFIFKINSITNQYWFITAYIGLYILSPLLNKFVENVTKKELVTFIVIFYLFQFYYQTMMNNTFQSGYSILSFCGLYLLGRYIRLNNYNVSSKESIKTELLLFFVVTIIMMIGVLSYMIIFNKSTLDIKANFIGGFIYNNPLVILQSVIIFLIFKKIKIRSKFINYCASSSLAIYLLHMHPDIKPYFYNFTESLYSKPYIFHLSILIATFIAIFFISILLDKIRIFCFEKLYTKIEILKNRLI